MRLPGAGPEGPSSPLTAQAGILADLSKPIVSPEELAGIAAEVRRKALAGDLIAGGIVLALEAKLEPTETALEVPANDKAAAKWGSAVLRKLSKDLARRADAVDELRKAGRVADAMEKFESAVRMLRHVQAAYFETLARRKQEDAR